MQKYPFTKGKYEYIDDPEVRREEFALQMQILHPELLSDNSEYDILYAIKYDKENKTYWKQGLFNGVYKDEATVNSKNALNKKGKASNAIVKRPDINSHINTYVSVGEFKKDSDRATIDNVQRIWALYCDVDIHHVSLDIVDSLIPKVYGRLMQAVYAGKLPKFNLVNLTGGGFGLFFRYKEALDVSIPENAALHLALFKKITGVIDSVIKKNEDVFKIDGNFVVNADTNVSNINRNCRISGSYHMGEGDRFATLLAIDDEYHDFNDLCQFMGVTLENKEIKETKEKKANRGVRSALSDIPLLNRDHLSPATSNCAKRRIEQVVHIMKNRGGYDGDKRHSALFCLWNYARLIYDETYAIQLTYDLNAIFAEPINDKKWFEDLFEGKNYDLLSGETFSNELCLSPDEESDIRLYERRNIKRAEKERREAKKNRKELAITLFNKGVSYKDIMKEVGCCASTCYKWLKEAGIDVKQNKNVKKTLKKNPEKMDGGDSAPKFFDSGATINSNTIIHSYINNIALYSNISLYNNIGLYNYIGLYSNISLYNYNKLYSYRIIY